MSHNVALRVYSMLKRSCKPFVPECFWFSDSAGWMWPCDPLVARERAVGPWRARLLSGRANYRGLSEIYMVRLLYVCECVWIGWLQAVVADMVWLNATERRVRRVCCYVSQWSSLVQSLPPDPSDISCSSNYFGKHACEPFREVRVWWKLLSACRETESVCWGCTHHRYPFSFCDGFEASVWFTG